MGADVPTYMRNAVSRELGVRFVLEGSIRANDNRIRVAVRLNDTLTGAAVWSERYERTLDEIFDVQNDVTQKIAAALGGTSGSLSALDAATTRRRPPSNLHAYDYYVMGLELHFQFTKDELVKAEEMFRKAIEIDPQFARAYAALADLYDTQAWYGWISAEPAEVFEKAKAVALQGVALALLWQFKGTF